MKLLPDFSAIKRPYHTSFGVASWVNRAPYHSPEKLYLNHAKNTRELYRIDHFTVVEVEVDVGEEALGSRLPEGANCKRARSQDPEPCNHQPQFSRTSTRIVQKEAVHRRRSRRGRSEDPEDFEYILKRRRLEPPQYVVNPTIEHEGTEMSRSSPGKRKRQQDSHASAQAIDENEDYSYSGRAGQAEEEIADSAEEEVTNQVCR